MKLRTLAREAALSAVLTLLLSVAVRVQAQGQNAAPSGPIPTGEVKDAATGEWVPVAYKPSIHRYVRVDPDTNQPVQPLQVYDNGSWVPYAPPADKKAGPAAAASGASNNAPAGILKQPAALSPDGGVGGVPASTGAAPAPVSGQTSIGGRASAAEHGRWAHGGDAHAGQSRRN